MALIPEQFIGAVLSIGIRTGSNIKWIGTGFFIVKNLGEKTITFDPDKINVIFGPNGCGKTTILKAIANVCLCGDKNSMDGYTNPYHLNPLCINGKLDDETKYNIDNYKM